MAKLETLSRYKSLSSNDDVRYLAPDITQEAISNWKPEEKNTRNNTRRKIYGV